MKNLFTGLLSALIFSSCASTQLLTISVLQPAPVTLPNSIKNVLVVDRTQVNPKNKILDAVDKVVTLEGANLDKEAAEQTILGLTEELKKNNRFNEIRMISNSGLTTNVPGTFPAPLSWDIVKKFCDENDADALFSLELFDTDSKIDYSIYKGSLKTLHGDLPSIQQQANLRTLVKAGWRIYNIRDRQILDEMAISRTVDYHARGISPVLAANALISRKEAIKEVGNISGHAYAFRIIPLWIRVSRDYFVKGSGNFKIAKRKAQTGNWDEAAELWKLETSSQDRKVAGRACYNMAIISEINGDLNTAIRWAQQAYENYNNRLGLTYVNILRKRQINDARAADQQAMTVNQ